jgi:hypothetical protein
MKMKGEGVFGLDWIGLEIVLSEKECAGGVRK